MKSIPDFLVKSSSVRREGSNELPEGMLIWDADGCCQSLTWVQARG